MISKKQLKSWLLDVKVIKLKIQPDGDLDDIEEGYDRVCSLEKKIRRSLLTENIKEGRK